MHNETTDQLINPSPQKAPAFKCAHPVLEFVTVQALKTLLAHSISKLDALTLPAQSSG